MDLREFRGQVDNLKQTVSALSFAEIDEVLFGALQSQLLSLIGKLEPSGSLRADVLEVARGLTQALVQVAERDELALSDEIEALVDEYSILKRPIERSVSVRPSKPLASFPRQAPVKHTVFVDEAGTASFTEQSQPVMCLVGVLVEDAQIERFDLAVRALLLRNRIEDDAEIHAQPLISGEEPFNSLNQEQRDALLKEFIVTGLEHAVGLHYLNILKPLIKPGFRQKIEELGHDVYTSNVVHFTHLLKTAVFGKAGLIRYRYLFDDTPKYTPLVKRIFEALRDDPNPSLRLGAVDGSPVPVDSKDHRFIQLADVVAYFLVRYRQFEVKTYQPREALRKHAAKYYDIHEIIKPYVMSYVANDLYLLLDLPAVQAWALPQRKKRPERGSQ